MVGADDKAMIHPDSAVAREQQVMAAHPAVGAPAQLERDYVAGGSWLLYGSGVRLQANYVRRLTDQPVRRDVILVDFQTAW